MRSVFTKTMVLSVALGVLLPSVVQANGEELTFNRKKGNCIACHAMPTANPKKATLPGNMAPPLVAMKARYPDKATLRAQIYDATVKNKYTTMPPFGRHEALSSKDIDAITNYIYTL